MTSVADVGRGEPATELSRRDRRQAEQRRGLPAQVVHEAIRREGEDELARPPAALFWSGLAAGLSMGFSLAAEGLLRAHLPAGPWQILISSFGYSLGFLIVILGRQQLFTENTLTVILPLLTRRDVASFVAVARLWAVVLAANLLGAFVFASVVGHTDVFRADIRQVFELVSREAMDGSPVSVFIRGIFAGWLIALMVWLLPSAESNRVWIIVILTYVVSLGGLTHVIAGSVEGFYLVTTGVMPAWTFAGQFLVPTLLGNVVGGVSLVAALNHAQVVSGGAGEESGKARQDPEPEAGEEAAA